MKEFPKYIFDERLGLWYELGEHDLYYLLDELPEENSWVGKYGSMRRRYLKENDKSYYMHLYVAGTLVKHLKEVNERASDAIKDIVVKMAKSEGCDGELKMHDQMKWVGLMNNYHACAEEIVLGDIVCI